jgi:hypothetical protein
VKITHRETLDGVYVVTAAATDKSGRTDESTGAVNIQGLKGDALANGLMKAETKAKRRVTLSICGLGLLDETEVETIPGAIPVQDPGPKALPQGGQHAAPTDAAGTLANMLIRTMKESTNQAELASAKGLVTTNKAKLSTDDLRRLTDVYNGLLGSLPDAVDEPGSNDDVDADLGEPVAAAK